MWTALELLVLWLVAQAAVTDLALRKIPNILVVSGLRWRWSCTDWPGRHWPR